MIVILKKKNCSFRILCGWHNMQYILIIKFLKLKWSFTRIQTVNNLYHNNTSKKYCNQFIFYVDISTQYIRYYYIFIIKFLWFSAACQTVHYLYSNNTACQGMFDILYLVYIYNTFWELKVLQCLHIPLNFFDFWMIFASFMHNSCLQS